MNTSNPVIDHTSPNICATPQPDTPVTRLLDERQAAALLDVSVALMRKMRRLGTGPIVTRIGRLCRYAESDLAAFITANREEKAA